VDGQYYTDKQTQIKLNLKKVQSNIQKAANYVGRRADEVKLVAVTKMQPVEIIQAGIMEGIGDFGENYAESAAEKIQQLKIDIPVKWHMIGHIQSRKARTVCEYFDMVHSVDRMKIAKYIDRYSAEMNKVMPILLEVNLSGEESKSGWSAFDEEQWQSLVIAFREFDRFSNLEIKGLMTMPPLYSDPEKTRPIYQKLRKFQKYLIENLPKFNWRELSIGTSFDYMVAVEEGATLVRIGTEIFGERLG
jgi:pyridoxal phosphate enzyme (YggS family)